MSVSVTVRTMCRAKAPIKEPLWTGQEVEKFWTKLKPYIQQLLKGEINALPHPDIDTSNMNKDSYNHYDQCILDIQELMWTGKYSLAVSNLREANQFFEKTCQSTEKYTEELPDKDSELNTLEAIFMKKLPRR